MGFPTQDGQEGDRRRRRDPFSGWGSNERRECLDQGSGPIEGRLIDAFLAGSELRLQVTSARGNETTDVYSLLGFTAALRQAREACS